jgi:hypothetical protein
LLGGTGRGVVNEVAVARRCARIPMPEELADLVQ